MLGPPPPMHSESQKLAGMGREKGKRKRYATIAGGRVDRREIPFIQKALGVQ